VELELALIVNPHCLVLLNYVGPIPSLKIIAKLMEYRIKEIAIPKSKPIRIRKSFLISKNFQHKKRQINGDKNIKNHKI